MKKALLGLLFAVLSLGGAFVANQAFAAEQVDNTPDCDTVAIIKCGAFSESEMRADAAKGDVQTVYNAFGISKTALAGSYSSGIVWKDGRVTVGGKTVATGATTAGRWNSPKSGMTRIAGTDRAYKMSTSHFVTEGQTAFVKFDANGKFLFAIIKSCGNPVVAKPLVPLFYCNSLAVTRINRTAYQFTAKATGANVVIVSYTYNFGDGTVITGPNKTPGHTYAKPGTYTAKLSVTFRLNTNGAVKTVTSAGCTVKVTVPPVPPAPSWSCDSLTKTLISGNTYRFDTKSSAINGAKITAHTFDYGDGQKQTIQTVNNNTAQSATHTYAKPGTYTIRATQTVLVNGATTTITNDKCVVKITVAPAPSYACDGLTATKIARDNYMFTAKGSAANGATITKYAFNYGDGKTADVTTGATTANASHVYTAPGEYTASVTLTIKVGTATKLVGGEKCTVKVTVEEKPAPPTYSCDELKSTKIDRTKFGFAAKASAAGGATITKYHFDFGDTKSADVTTAAKTASTEHTYDKAGEYTIRTTVSVLADGKTVPVTSSACVTKITVEEKPVPPTYSCDELTFTKTNRTTYAFTAKGSAAGGATITKYNFNFGDSKTADVPTAAKTASTTHEYTEAKEYTIRATISVLANGQTIPVTSDKCVVKVTVEEKPETPAYDCKSLGAELIGEKEDRTFKYNLTYTATGGATLRDVDFNFGDNSAAATFTPAQLANVTHAYAADGEYKTVATLHFNVNDTVVDKTCEVKVNPANPPEECKPGIPVGDVRCTECKPGIPTGDARCTECKPGIPAGDARCEECKPGVPAGDEQCEEAPHVLPATGPEAIISGLLGTSAIGYGAYSYAASRRTLRNSWKR